jgi:hypothetical protein
VNPRARRTVILTIAVVVVVLILITVAFPAMPFVVKIGILLVTLVIAILVLRNALAPSKPED